MITIREAILQLLDAGAILGNGEAHILVAFLHEGETVVSPITSITINGKAVQLNEFDFDQKIKFESENQ